MCPRTGAGTAIFFFFHLSSLSFRRGTVVSSGGSQLYFTPPDPLEGVLSLGATVTVIKWARSLAHTLLHAHDRSTCQSRLLASDIVARLPHTQRPNPNISYHVISCSLFRLSPLSPSPSVLVNVIFLQTEIVRGPTRTFLCKHSALSTCDT